VRQQARGFNSSLLPPHSSLRNTHKFALPGEASQQDGGPAQQEARGFEAPRCRCCDRTQARARSHPCTDYKRAPKQHKSPIYIYRLLELNIRALLTAHTLSLTSGRREGASQGGTSRRRQQGPRPSGSCCCCCCCCCPCYCYCSGYTVTIAVTHEGGPYPQAKEGAEKPGKGDVTRSSEDVSISDMISTMPKSGKFVIKKTAPQGRS
jgi:hypothetical protein